MVPEYVTFEQLADALKGSAGAGARTAAELDPDRLQAALNEAHAEVLGKLATIYVLPADADTAPDLVKGLVTAVASYVATLEWLQGKDLSDRDPVVLRYTRAQTMLGQILAKTLEVDGMDTAGAGAAGVQEAYDANPYVNLAGDVEPPSYWGSSPSFGGAYQGGGWTWR